MASWAAVTVVEPDVEKLIGWPLIVPVRLRERFSMRRLLAGKLKLLLKLKVSEPSGPELMIVRLNELALIVVVELKLDDPNGPGPETLKLNVAGRPFAGRMFIRGCGCG